MAYLAQPVIVGSHNVVVVGDAHTSTMNIAGNIVRSSHYIPDPSSGLLSASTDPHSLHPTLKSLPYPLTLPPVMTNNNTINTSGANFEEFEDEEDDADTGSLMSAESFTDNNSIFPSTSYNSNSAIPIVGSFRENSMAARGSSLAAANVRSQSMSRSPIAYHRIPVGVAYPIIPTVPSAAVAVAVGAGVVVAGRIHNNGSTSVLVDRVPGSRVVQGQDVPRTTRGDNVEVTSSLSLSEECNVCHLDISSPSSPSTSPQSPLSPSRSPTNNIMAIISTCSSAHTYHIPCFQSALLQPAIARTVLPACPAPCGQHIPARYFLHAVSSEMKRRYLKSEMEIMMGMDGDEEGGGGF